MVLTKLKKESKAEVGDYKIVKRFAWWPTNVSGVKIWLEEYKDVYEWKVRNRINYLRCLGVIEFPNCGGWDLIATQRING